VFNGELSNKPAVSDEFSLRVLDDTALSWSAPSRSTSSSSTSSSSTDVRRHPSAVLSPVRCPHGLSLTTATIVLDVDPAKVSAADRVRLLTDVGRHFQLPATLFRLRRPPVDRPLLDLNSALAAGPGDLSVGAAPLHEGLLVQWDVGCGNVRAELMPSLELLETSAADGRLRRSLVGHPSVVGWHIAKKTRSDVVGPSSRRAPKHAPRFVAATATPAQPLVVMPTKRVDIITVTVQAPPSTAVVGGTTASVVIVPTATDTTPPATATWTSSSPLDVDASTDGDEEDVEIMTTTRRLRQTTVGSVVTDEDEDEDEDEEGKCFHSNTSLGVQ
jgi:hypothetical protein